MKRKAESNLLGETQTELYETDDLSVWSCFLFVSVYSDAALSKCSAKGRDDEMAQKLWDLTCKQLSITWDWGDLDSK